MDCQPWSQDNDKFKQPDNKRIWFCMWHTKKGQTLEVKKQLGKKQDPSYSGLHGVEVREYMERPEGYGQF